MIKHVHKTLSFLVLMAMVLPGLVGCGASAILANTPTFDVPIKVWRVQDVGWDVHGDTGNFGCRLSDAEITTLMNQILNNDMFFMGFQSRLVWDNSITDVDDPSIHFNREQNGSALQIAIFNLQDAGVVIPEPNSINVFFSGDYFAGIPSAMTDVAGATINPSNIPTNHRLFPGIIFVNDFGDDDPPGFPAKDLDKIQSRLTAEHEVAHYLARFQR